MRRLVLAIAVCGGCLTVASPAFATATRAEYALEVNIICQTSEADFLQAGKKLAKAAKSRKKGLAKLSRALDRINDVYEGVVAQVALVPAAPGDETLVASWVASLQELAALSDETLDLTKKLARATKNPKLKLKPFFRLFGKLFEVSADIERAAGASDALGTVLGATSCVGKGSALSP